MTPTPELRFVERYHDTLSGQKIIRVLQQKWVGECWVTIPLTMGGTITGESDHEWRDVPLVKEDV